MTAAADDVTGREHDNHAKQRNKEHEEDEQQEHLDEQDDDPEEPRGARIRRVAQEFCDFRKSGTRESCKSLLHKWISGRTSAASCLRSTYAPLNADRFSLFTHRQGIRASDSLKQLIHLNGELPHYLLHDSRLTRR